jgi:6-pyruvoyltetrahydropterin/6-carboxytetrahydropterin synthase
MEGLIPSTENFAVAIWNELVDALPSGRLFAVRLHETENNLAEYRGE